MTASSQSGKSESVGSTLNLEMNGTKPAGFSVVFV